MLTKADRIRYLGTGPTASVKPVYVEGGASLLVPTGGGVVPQDPDISNRLNPSFWYEE